MEKGLWENKTISALQEPGRGLEAKHGPVTCDPGRRTGASKEGFPQKASREPNPVGGGLRAQQSR